MAEPGGLHISIGHGIGDGSNLSLEGELRLVKLALLYGDTVSLHSPKSAMLMAAKEVAASENILAHVPTMRTIVAPEYRGGYDQLLTLSQELEIRMAEIRKYPREQRRTIERQIRMDMQKSIYRFRSQMNQKVAHTGINDIYKLSNKGKLQVERYENDIGEADFVERFTKRIIDMLSHDDSFPLLDEQTARLVRLYISEGLSSVSPARANRASQIKLSANFMGRLPNFEEAKVDEILDIRKTLAKPLIRFRAAIVEFSKELKSAAWDDDFVVEAENLYQAKVEPTILEIQESVELSRIMHHVLSKSLGGATASFVSAGLAALVVPEEILDKETSALMVGGLTTAASALQEYFAEKRKAEQNQMYFLYRARRILS
jgi:hypothetical protein